MNRTAERQNGRTAEDYLREKYNLSYHVPFAFEAERRVGLKGKKVLEIGGSLPRGFVLEDIGAAQWVAVEEMSYYKDINIKFTKTGEKINQITDVTDLSEIGDYAIISGRAEQLTPPFFQYFDVVFSLSAFEHIDRFPAAIDRMHQTLKPGGRLFSMFSPIWSSRAGHHLHDITDKNGITFSFSNLPIPPWGHLFMRPPEMFNHLLSHTDEETASEITFNIYNSAAVNRLFTEDYVDYFNMSPFKIDDLVATFSEPPPEGIQKHLEGLYPGRRRFDNHGLMVTLTRSC